MISCCLIRKGNQLEVGLKLTITDSTAVIGLKVMRLFLAQSEGNQLHVIVCSFD